MVSVQQILSGKDFERTLRGFRLADEALSTTNNLNKQFFPERLGELLQLLIDPTACTEDPSLARWFLSRPVTAKYSTFHQEVCKSGSNSNSDSNQKLHYTDTPAQRTQWDEAVKKMTFLGQHSQLVNLPREQWLHQKFRRA